MLACESRPKCRSSFLRHTSWRSPILRTGSLLRARIQSNLDELLLSPSPALMYLSLPLCVEVCVASARRGLPLWAEFLLTYLRQGHGDPHR